MEEANIYELMERKAVPNKGDFYDKNGILHCGICGAAKEFKGIWPGIGEIRPRCACKCELRESQKQSEQREKVQKELIAQTRRGWAFPSEELEKAVFGRDDGKDKAASAETRKYAQNIDKNIRDGKNVVFFGDVGTGKSFFAACLVNSAIDKGYRCLFTSFPKVINEIIAASDKQGYINEIANYDLVVFDDFGTERNTDFANEQIYQIVNARYLARKPVIITTNMDKNELNTKDMNKKRILSRIFERSTVIAMSGEDRRMEKFRRIREQE